MTTAAEMGMSEEEIQSIMAGILDDGEAKVIEPVAVEKPVKAVVQPAVVIPEPEPVIEEVAIPDNEQWVHESPTKESLDRALEHAVENLPEASAELTDADIEAMLNGDAALSAEVVEVVAEAAVKAAPKAKAVKAAEPAVVREPDTTLIVPAVVEPTITAPVITVATLIGEDDITETIEADSTPSVTQYFESAGSSHTPIKKGGVIYYIDPARLKADTHINPLNIDEALASNAQMFVYYATQSALARAQFERMKAAFEILESRLDNIHRKALKEENAKTTEAQIRSAVVSDKAWIQANSRMIDCRTIYDLANDAKEAFTMRRDAVIQMSKDQREERGSITRIAAAKVESNNQRESVMDQVRNAK